MMAGWVSGLVEERGFFEGCGAHQRRKKSEKNIFCLRCCASLCAHCTPAHPSHPLLQVRRYVYNDVVRLDDLEKLIDCSYVQPYTINSAKVIFLKPRPQSRPFKGSGNICLACDRILQDPFHFCSLSCKVDHVMAQGGDVTSILLRFDESEFNMLHFESFPMEGSDLVDDGDRNTHNSILEETFRYGDCSGSSSGSRGVAVVEVPKRKKGRGFFPHVNVLSMSSRRKGAPQRSPLS
ncbi:hypothetical protein ACMD2_12258 [Ananas comosus]|nr:hypothetical protein ACMD2_12258 [Ananas comosus]